MLRDFIALLTKLIVRSTKDSTMVSKFNLEKAFSRDS